MTTGRGYISDAEIGVLEDALIAEIMTETVYFSAGGVVFNDVMVRHGLWRAIRKGALDDILYNRGVDFDAYED